MYFDNIDKVAFFLLEIHFEIENGEAKIEETPNQKNKHIWFISTGHVTWLISGGCFLPTAPEPNAIHNSFRKFRLRTWSRMNPTEFFKAAASKSSQHATRLPKLFANPIYKFFGRPFYPKNLSTR